MNDPNGTNNQGAEFNAKLQKLLASHELLLNSQDSLLGGYHALYDAIRAIVDAHNKRRFLTEELKQSLNKALDASGESLKTYLDTLQKAKEP